jgi:hypothetical protein
VEREGEESPNATVTSTRQKEQMQLVSRAPPRSGLASRRVLSSLHAPQNANDPHADQGLLCGMDRDSLQHGELTLAPTRVRVVPIPATAMVAFFSLVAPGRAYSALC